MNEAGFSDAGYLRTKTVYYQNRCHFTLLPEDLEKLMGNACQQFTGGRDRAPSLQFLKVPWHCKNTQQYVIRMSIAL